MPLSNMRLILNDVPQIGSALNFELLLFYSVLCTLGEKISALIEE